METSPKPTISFADFEQVQLCVGTILTATPNPKAKKPSYIITADFGPHGVKTSSAQLTQNYSADDLIGKQIVAVLNFPPRRIADVSSEVLIVGALCPDNGVVLLHPSKPVQNGAPLG
jgi:tRNA-binding protein